MKERYFQVEKETLYGDLYRGVVNRDGSEYETPEDMGEKMFVVTGFYVRELDEYGVTIGGKFYPVITNAETGDNNEEEVLNKIEADHPATEWQCNNW